METIIKVDNLRKYYGESRGVEDVTLSILKGEVYGFIGPNGAGKSTTIRTIMGLIDKDSGEIYIKNKKIDRNDINTKKLIGYLPSEVHLYDDMTVKQILDYHETFYNENLKDRRNELVSLLQIDETKKTEDLSLGNLKKVGIVLALMHNPEIIILDEPTSGLDPIMQNVFHDILLKEKKKGSTIVYSSHVLSEVSSICDRVGIIKEGRIIKEDLIENIKNESCTYVKVVSSDIKDIIRDLNLKVKEETEDSAILINNLEPNVLIDKLKNYDIEHLLIEEMPLEDMFMDYYK